MIIEYQGSVFHPNREELNESQWSDWKQLFTDRSADIVYKMDDDKKKLAIDNGFDYLTVWSSGDNNEKIFYMIKYRKNTHYQLNIYYHKNNLTYFQTFPSIGIYYQDKGK